MLSAAEPLCEPRNETPGLHVSAHVQLRSHESLDLSMPGRMLSAEPRNKTGLACLASLSPRSSGVDGRWIDSAPPEAAHRMCDVDGRLQSTGRLSTISALACTMAPTSPFAVRDTAAINQLNALAATLTLAGHRLCCSGSPLRSSSSCRLETRSGQERAGAADFVGASLAE